MAEFTKLGLNDWIVEHLQALGMPKPTEIQRNCIPPILAGRNCLGCARTGSGKTAAFALPILQRFVEDPFGVFAVVITPTRELAFQIGEQFRILGKPVNLQVSVIVGGRDYIRQGQEVDSRPHVLVITPGRLADHLRSGTEVPLGSVRFVVLDEADRLLEDDFGADLQLIFSRLPAKRQTLLFSATCTSTLLRLLEMSSGAQPGSLVGPSDPSLPAAPSNIDVKTTANTKNAPFAFFESTPIATVDELEQFYIVMPADFKDAYLVYVLVRYLRTNPKSSVILFAQTCKYAQLLSIVLESFEVKTACLHSLAKQRDRLLALASFRDMQVRVLIATDVASRGLDVTTADLVINHNVPTRPKDYIHRVGRTARAGRSGTAITLVTQFDIKLVHAIEATINTKLREYPDIDNEEVASIVAEVSIARRAAELRLSSLDFGVRREEYKRLLHGDSQVATASTSNPSTPTKKGESKSDSEAESNSVAKELTKDRKRKRRDAANSAVTSKKPTDDHELSLRDSKAASSSSRRRQSAKMDVE